MIATTQNGSVFRIHNPRRSGEAWVGRYDTLSADGETWDEHGSGRFPDAGGYVFRGAPKISKVRPIHTISLVRTGGSWRATVSACAPTLQSCSGYGESPTAAIADATYHYSDAGEIYRDTASASFGRVFP